MMLQMLIIFESSRTVLVAATTRNRHQAGAGAVARRATASEVVDLPLDRGEVSYRSGVPEPDANPPPRATSGRRSTGCSSLIRTVGGRPVKPVRQFAADASHKPQLPAAIRGYTGIDAADRGRSRGTSHTLFVAASHRADNTSRRGPSCWRKSDSGRPDRWTCRGLDDAQGRSCCRTRSVGA